MPESSPSLLSLLEHTLTYIHTHTPSFPHSVLQSFSLECQKQTFFFFWSSFSVSRPYQICVLVNTLNLIDSRHLIVYVCLFPSVPVVYLYIKCDVSEALERTMKRSTHYSQTSLFIQRHSYHGSC